MDYTVVESGQRNVAQLDYKGHRIQVVTGYSAATDKYPIHIYAQKIGVGGQLVGRQEKLDIRGHADRMEEAFEAGLLRAQAEIDQQ